MSRRNPSPKPLPQRETETQAAIDTASRLGEIKGRGQVRLQVCPLLRAIAQGDQDKARILAIELSARMQEESQQEREELMART